ncbi:MAG: glycosyltransferase family 2 protein [Nitrospirae bacterium]|nr:MAG: glycosyltransferase family 2 protein [Nitrospirota bacterium]
MDPDLTIIMCVYNEMGRIQASLDELFKALEGRRELVEVLVLDNCSTDGTREWLKTVIHPVAKVQFNERNLGKGGSVKRGMKLSRGRHVIIHDADQEYQASEIWTMLDRANETKSQLVLGSRVLGGCIRHEYVYYRNYLGVRFLTWLINALYGCRITDAATALKLMDGDVARSLDLRCSGFDLDFELVARVVRKGYTVEETAVQYRPRTKREGKKIRAWRDGLLALWAILVTRFR